jgi:hypothetical protein
MTKRTKKTTKTTAPKIDLPPNVQPADLKYPAGGRTLGYEREQALGLESPRLTFYKTERLGWVLCTLHISNPSRRQAAGTTARTYAIGVADKKIYTVGRGPHVTAEVSVWLSQDNIDRLSEYVALYQRGLADAGQIRDRISSRRAQGQLYRAAGRTSWMW